MTFCLNSMTSRELQSRLKQGYTTEDFCVTYSCTQDEFFGFIEKIYSQPRKREEISRRLKSNAKAKKTATSPAKSTRSTLAAAKASHVPAKTKPAAAPKAEAAPEESKVEVLEVLEAPAPEPAQSEPTELETLQAREESLSAALIQLEVEHKDAWSKHNAVANTIRGISDRVEQLKAELGELVDEYESQLAVAREAEAVMANKSEEHRIKHAELETVRARIAELTAIKVFVYEDGTFEAENYNLYFDDSWETRYDELLKSDSELLEDLRKKDLRTLAKLMSLVSNGRTFDFAFDNATVEAAYYALK